MMAASLDDFHDLEELGIDVSSNGVLDENFTKAADHVQTLVAKLSSDDLLTLYGYYKQSTEGRCAVPKPSWYDMKAKSKWEAWNKLGDLSKTQAKTCYFELVKKLDPDFDFENKEQWVHVSTLSHNDDNAGGDDSKTLIDFVKDGDSDNVVKNLKGKRVDNVLDDSGLGLVHWGADSGSVDVLRVLLDSGGDLNLKDCDGQTPLHYASSCGHLDAVKFLLEHGADKNLKDEGGFTPFDVAYGYSVKELLS